MLISLLALVGSFAISIAPNPARENISIQPLSSSPIIGEDVKYLIITTNEFKSRLESLALWKSQKGLNAQIETVENIELLYSGYDTPAKIKACIEDYYSNYNTEFVLLAGDHQHVPTRLAYVDEGYPDGDYVGCDSYYGNFNNWDSDGDLIYGEDNDDWNLTANVYVGRLSANTAGEMQTLVNRIILYESDPPVGDWMKTALFAGSMTYFNSDEYAPGDGVLDYPEADGNRFFNYVYDQFYDNWTVTLLAEDSGIPEGRSDYLHNASLTATSLKQGIDNGASILGVLGHGNAYGIYRTIWNTDRDGDGLFDWVGAVASQSYDYKSSIPMIDAYASGYTNPSDMLSVTYLMGCSNGNFTTLGVDSLAEYMLKTVSIGSIGGDRIVWGEDNWTERVYGGWYSEGLAYRFFEQLNTHDQPGRAFALAKQDYCEDNVTLNMSLNTWIDEPRWSEKTLKQFNYFGDPELHVWMAIPEALNATWTDYNDTATLIDVYTDGSGPIELATVSLTDNSQTVIWTGTTNGSGQLVAPYPYLTVNSSVIVVSKPSYIPLISAARDFPTPDAPVLLEISPQLDRDGTIRLEWTAVTGALSYNVYRSSSVITDVSELTAIASTEETHYIDRGTEDGLHFYAITMIGSSGESIPSNCVYVTVDRLIIPGFSITILSIVGFVGLIMITSVIMNKSKLKR